MGIICHQPSIMQFGHLGHFRNRCQVPIHRKNPVGDDKAMFRRRAMRFEELGQVSHIIVSEPKRCGSREIRP